MHSSLSKLLVLPTTNNYILLFRYGFVAVVSAVFDVGGLVLLKEFFGLNYLVAAALSFCLGTTVNFFISTGWVFRNPKTSKRHIEFLGVFTIALLGLAINDGILWFLTSQLAIYYLYSKFIAMAIILFWNFFVRK